MKRFLAFILAALMLLTLAACGSNGGNTDPQPDNDQNQTDEPSKDRRRAMTPFPTVPLSRM